MSVERADPAGPEARRLLRAHELEMVARYGGGDWQGTSGRKDALWLARDSDTGEAVGCVVLRELRDGLVEVKHLYVVPDARRRGMAGALMDAFEAEARRRRAAVVLETGDAQPEALAFYEARGYRRRGPYPGCEFETERSRYYELGLDLPEADLAV